MKKLALAAAAALMAAGTTVATTTPADARVVVGIGIGPGFYGPGYYPGRFCDPYSYYYDPYRCDGDGFYGDYFYDPIFFGGYWYRGPFRYRYWHGDRWFWVNHGWHRNEWHGAFPNHMTFHGGWNGGHSWGGHNWGGHWSGRGSWGGGHHHH